MIRTLLLAILTLAATQQTAPRDAAGKPPQGTAVVSGVVLSGTGAGTAPARRARVMLHDTAGVIDGRAVTTDDDGRFEFRDVAEGRYTIEVYKPGFLRSFFGATRPERAGTPVPVAAGGRADNLTIRISQGGAIGGTVRDERGRPVPGVNVTPLRYGYSFSGDRRLSSPVVGSTTDDRGIYRLWGLPPGDYIVAVEPRVNTLTDALGVTDFQVLTTADVDRLLSAPAGAASASATNRANYATQFFPGTGDVSRALTIAVAGGEERSGVDLVITRITTARIRGAVTMPDGTAPKSVSVTLAQSGDVDMVSAAIRPRSIPVDASGQFEFQDVGPGSYTVTARTERPRGAAQAAGAQPPILYAQSPVTVSGQDVELPLQLSPAMTISGRLVFQGGSPPPQNLDVIQIYMVPPNSGGNLGAGPPGGQVSNEATFKFEGVTPGPYRMIWSSRGQLSGDWWIRSATANGRDALDQALVVTHAQDVELVVAFTDRPTELAGVFQDATGRPASEYFIVVFPADPAAWSPGSRRVRSTRPGSDGRFSIRGLPAGDYLLAALTDLLPEDLNDREVLKALLPAVPVTLVEGQTTRQDLRAGR